jgi:hypothetical protein
MAQTVQVLRTTTANNSPPTLLPGALSVELSASWTKLWVGAAGGNRLLLSSNPADAPFGTSAFLPLKGGTLTGPIAGTSLTLSSPLAVASGGTGAVDAAGARTSLGLGPLATQALPVPVASGGTGAVTAPTALANLGGISGNQTITLSGAISGSGATAITTTLATVPIASGGTNATTAPAALTNLGAAPLGAINDVGRNLVQNPIFNVAQRGAGPFTVANYGLDRWRLNIAGGTMSVSQLVLADADRAAIGDESAIFALQSACVGTAGAADETSSFQSIENVRRLAGKTVTVSFWARATAGTPKVAVELFQSFGSGGSPSAPIFAIGSQAFTLSTNWTRYTSTPIALPSVAGKTFGTNLSTDFTVVNFWQSSGTNATARAANIGVQSYTLQLWGVQLEIGSTATPLEKPDPQQDRAKCQRFYQVGQIAFQGYASAVQGVYATAYFMTSMRANPTITTNTNSSTNVGALSWIAAVDSTGVSLSAPTLAGGVYSLNAAFIASADL